MHFPPLNSYRLMKKREERTDDSKHWIWRWRCYKMLQEDKRRKNLIWLKMSGKGVLELRLARCAGWCRETKWGRAFPGEGSTTAKSWVSRAAWETPGCWYSWCVNCQEREFRDEANRKTGKGQIMDNLRVPSSSAHISNMKTNEEKEFVV